MSLGKALLREKTLPPKKKTQTLYTTSVYVPVYGKTTHTIGGRGSPGNPATGGNPAGTNPQTGGNASYNPTTGGNYAGTNPSTPGNYAGTNPDIPGNYAGTNPSTGGNISYNPTSGGNYAGVNSPIYLYNITEYSYQGSNYYTIPNTTQPSSTYWANDPTNSGYPSYETYTVNSYAIPSAASTVAYVSGVVSNSTINGYTYTTPPGQDPYYFFQYKPQLNGYSAGTPYTNPVSGGTAYYNPVVAGNKYYNPTTPGNPYYNTPTPGNPYYNPVVAGNAYYNPVVPGNPIYNPVVQGNPGSPTTVMGVSFPGGDPGAPAPLVSPTKVTINYDPAGVSITVPPGGYVDVTNS